jgi:DNA-binding protein H-NS
LPEIEFFVQEKKKQLYEKKQKEEEARIQILHQKMRNLERFLQTLKSMNEALITRKVLLKFRNVITDAENNWIDKSLFSVFIIFFFGLH